jgi:phosphoglycolate phosphatase
LEDTAPRDGSSGKTEDEPMEGKFKLTRPGVVVWDFNGTLIDDVSLAVRSINRMLSRRGLPALSMEAYRRVFGFPLAEYYRAIGFELAAETMGGLADEFHEGYLPGLFDCPLHEGVEELLRRIDCAAIPQFVLSAMEEESLSAALRRLGIEGLFAGVYGLNHRLADSKIERGRELLDRFEIPPESSLLIGDTDHDADVAAALGMSVALVAKGHQNAERLRALGPVFEEFADLATDLFSKSAGSP